METRQPGDNGRTVAILSYITLFGWILALIIHSGAKTRLGAFHLRQTLGLMILVVLVGIMGYFANLMPFGGLVIAVLNVGLLLSWAFGLIFAITSTEKPIPVYGYIFQAWFAGFGL